MGIFKIFVVYMYIAIVNYCLLNLVEQLVEINCAYYACIFIQLKFTLFRFKFSHFGDKSIV